MSRRLVIIILAILIIGVVGGTIAVVLSRLQSDATPTPTSDPGTLTEAPTGQQNVVDPTGDDDNDGLSNSDEALWGTNPTNPDTDGDGYLDGEEVAAGHNPTIPSPNDKLPPGFTPGREVNPLQPASQGPVAVDQFFVSGLDLQISAKNLTEEYKKQYSESEQTPKTLQDFALSQPIITDLPQPTERAVNLAQNETSETIEAYITAIDHLNVFYDEFLLENALAALYDNDPSIINGLGFTVRIYQEELIKLSVPPSAQNLHKLLVSYSELIATTYDQIGLHQTDPVKSIVALQQLEYANDFYHPIIEQELGRVVNLAQ